MTSVICTDDGWKIPDATPGPGQSGGGQFGWKVPDSQSEVSPPGSGQSGAGQAGVGQSLLPCIKDVTCKVGFVIVWKICLLYLSHHYEYLKFY